MAQISAVITPVFTLLYGQKDITHDIAPYVLSVTYTDNIKSESDEIDVQVEDTSGRWRDAWYPGKGDTLTLQLGYQGEALLDCGTFSIDEIELGAPPDTVSIRGVATSVNNALRTANSEGYEETTLAAIASRIAQKHGLALVGQIQPITIDRVTQYAETDVGFLKRLASDYGYALKVTADELIFSHLATLRSNAPVTTLTPQDVARWSLRDTINRIYKKATVSHQKSKDKTLVTYNSDGSTTTEVRGKSTSADTLKVNTRAADEGTAQVKADAALDSNNEYQQTGSLSLMGEPQLIAGNKITLEGFGVLSGEWLITSARHSFDRSSGYSTEIEVGRGPKTAAGGGKKKPGSLTTYHPDGTTTQGSK
ncbi:phage late control D family protein [Salmonella enterica]|uniref:phage late control D family protein n=1 Tax=Salmonella enterica TaxID=28901 RepID=UPI0021D4C9A2|nr:contractile injection system protein, VgrG/Pvc8 family [Salmonella enterica]MCU7097926.1 phage late control D family protein [Salmonella enterica]MCU7116331.1 phage late control D family protein [Salmonella enterica]MCU7122431.1 phage late control D family protein [Salmonella enterica]